MVAACRVVYDEADRDIHEKSACIRMTPAAKILADVKDDPVGSGDELRSFEEGSLGPAVGIR
jgi:hypothetical protein